MNLLNLLNSISIQIILQTLFFYSISAIYPKYYISNYCGQFKGSTIHLGPNGKTSALLKLKRETYKPNMDCNVTIRAPVNYGIIASVNRIKLRKHRSVGDSLEVISDNNMTSYKWFGNNEEMSPTINIISNSNRGEIYVVFKSENFVFSLSSKGFKLILTTFTLNTNGLCGQNSSLHFNCNNKLCIDHLLECDGTNNCINSYDEHNCSAGKETMIGPIVFGVTLLVMSVLVIIFLVKTDKQKRVDMARRFSRALVNGGRRLSTMLTGDHEHDRRPVPPTELLNQYSNNEPNIYRSVPIIYENESNGNFKENNLRYGSGDNIVYDSNQRSKNIN